ncbi:UDP-N-acetylmuramoyl-L-alanyl-D-glutamate--2,6-diaminopimelate ligase [Ferrimonas sediminicola]|uniref:UDP-N-acetylmuramoyl-L-alanyl-D-glutamate--2,6-diaminopimelate ligase n=1 Tax=Ferrimonas sediminicola TaxID=2569538 RepID=A0A4U1BJC2_9GAMM|nr:UDP-N-acetylmuramoyl-L-alanyl-D-glutamate--2,6-diaminopimelate ligase [Ferrimonas sediminicola]TKB51265.1 UDP-N-acetylmuramoyl-L-alanyl-D-glutamate--2,6-diaminopimelate ligase [Ferrimonas sediminicola]
MIALDDLLAPWMTLETETEVRGLTLDSRQVVPGDCFVAMPGHLVDGRDYIDAAVAKGAVAVLEEAERAGLIAEAPVLRIGLPQLASQLSAIALRAYPDAARPVLYGVTGTNGKTTVTQLLAQLHDLMGERAGVMGTVGNGLWGALEPSANTTSDALTVARALADQARAGAAAVALEVSSHGLSQHRVDALPFAVGIFTNLSRDHLDYHGDMNGYSDAKARLFELPQLQAGVFNLDDQYGAQWHRRWPTDKPGVGYSIDGATCRGHFLSVKRADYHPGGVSAVVDSSWGRFQLDSPLIGQFNLANLLAALGAMLIRGMELAPLLQAVSRLKPALGRMESFSAPGRATVVVDYAHTPDALGQALTALKHHCRGRLWCVFGCGGDRDRGKRPLMAMEAEALADELVLTADNPRSEAVADIIGQMQQGLSGRAHCRVETDRARAVALAVAEAGEKDMILVAGKGHEDYQIIGTERRHYDERRWVQQLMESVDD